MLTIFVFFYCDFFRFEQLTRDYDVKCFSHVKSRAIVMRYWEGQKGASYQQETNDLSAEHMNIILQSPKYDN